jgi:hypothetical protein
MIAVKLGREGHFIPITLVKEKTIHGIYPMHIRFGRQ